MNKKYSFLFPGQGSQFMGMGENTVNKVNFSLKYYDIAKDI